MSLRQKIQKKYSQNNRIFSVMFEVTNDCICNCIHCYLYREKKNELTSIEIGDLFDQLENEGVVNLGITGGEPFLREDIGTILELAKKKNFLTSLLTTGLLIGNAEINLLKKLKIPSLEFSLLGSNSETHDKIMNYPGAFEKILKISKQLISEGFEIGFKMTVMKDNYLELPLVKQLSKQIGAQFNPSILLTPSEDGVFNQESHLIENKELNNINLSDLKDGIITGDDYSSGAILICSAGKTTAGITPEGDILPCIIFRKKIGNIRENSINNIWHNNISDFLKEIRDLKESDFEKCNNCNLKKHCMRCPGIAYSEKKALKTESNIACKLAKIFTTK